MGVPQNFLKRGFLISVERAKEFVLRQIGIANDDV
jgi:hypothetical protein